MTKSNEDFGQWTVAAVLGVGLALSWLGASKWHTVIQQRDDRLATLQLEKLEAEIAKLRAETPPFKVPES